MFSKYPEKTLTCAKGHALCVVLCLLLSLALAMLPLELTPKLGLQLTQYRRGFLPNTTQRQGSQLHMKWLAPRAKNTVPLEHHHYFFLFSLNTQRVSLQWPSPPLAFLLHHAPPALWGALSATERVWCGARWLWYHSQAEQFEYRLCTLQLCGLRQSPYPSLASVPHL